MRALAFYTSTLLFSLVPSQTLADITPKPTAGKFDKRLLKDLFNSRNVLDARGIDVSAVLANDFVNIAHGSINNGSNYLNNLDFFADMDGKKAYNIPGNTIRIGVKSNAGGNPNLKRVKSLEGIDGNEVAKPQQALRLYEAWIKQEFLGKKISCMAGIMDVHNAYMAPNISANFIRYSFQVNQEFLQTPAGGNGPAVSPYSTLGGSLKISPVNPLYIQAAIYNGVTGDPKHPKKTAIKISHKRGAFYIAEAGFVPGSGTIKDNKIGVGVWRYSTKVPDLIDITPDGNPIKRYSQGLYAIAGYRVFDDPKTKRTLGVFLRGGSGDGNTAVVKWHLNGGIVATGFIPTRENGEIGVGVTRSHIAKKQIRANTTLGQRTKHNEYALEAYYKDDVYRGITLQPFGQLIKYPGANPKYKNVIAIGLRTLITL